MARGKRFVLVALVVAALGSVVGAFGGMWLETSKHVTPVEPRFHAGDKVTVIRDCNQRTSSGAVGKVWRGTPLEVMEVNGDLLLVTANVRGWIRAADVIPLDEAVEYFTQLIERVPRDARNYYYRAAVHQTLGDYDAAMRDYDEAVRLNPADPAYYTERAICFFYTKDFAGAASDVAQALRLQPKNHGAWVVRGVLNSETGNYAAAMDDWSTAARLAPTSIAPRANLVELLACCPDDSLRNGRQAVQIGTQLCEETDWKEPILLYYLACAYAESGDFESAIKWDNQALELMPLNKREDREHLEKALALFESEQPKRGLVQFGP